MSAVITLGDFLAQRQNLSPDALAAERIDLGAPRLHYASQDAWPSAAETCLDWRAEICLSALDAPGGAPEVVVGHVDFLIIQLGREPVAEVLALYGDRAAQFGALFEDTWLASELDESEGFTAGMPIGAVLVVLEARVDDRIDAACRLRPWAVAEVIDRMLPTTAGLAVMNALRVPHESARRPLVAADRIDADWALVGCIQIPGHPGFVGQATAYTYLEDARAQLATVREQPIELVVR